MAKHEISLNELFSEYIQYSASPAKGYINALDGGHRIVIHPDMPIELQCEILSIPDLPKEWPLDESEDHQV